MLFYGKVSKKGLNDLGHMSQSGDLTQFVFVHRQALWVNNFMFLNSSWKQQCQFWPFFGMEHLYGKKNQNCEIDGSTTPWGARGGAKYAKQAKFSYLLHYHTCKEKTECMVMISMKPTT